MQTVRFVPGQPVRLQTTPGDDLTVMLAPGERVADITISNHAVYQVTMAEARDSFRIHTSMTLFEGAPPSEGKITIGTERGTYEFQLSLSSHVETPYLLRFIYDRTEQKRARDKGLQYRLSGNKALKPSSIRDDGAKTYIQWSPEQAIPAVFALNRLNREEMVDGYMRAGVFTIDRVHDHLVFRIDKAKTEARRSVQETGK
jgi:type IV secretion system protein VirB9